MEASAELMVYQAGPMHGANEGANIAHLMQALKIYILALLRLQDLEL